MSQKIETMKLRDLTKEQYQSVKNKFPNMFKNYSEEALNCATVTLKDGKVDFRSISF